MIDNTRASQRNNAALRLGTKLGWRCQALPETVRYGDHVGAGRICSNGRQTITKPVSRKAGSQLAHFYGGPLCGRTLTCDLNRLLTSLAGEQEEAADDLLGLGKRAISNDH